MKTKNLNPKKWIKRHQKILFVSSVVFLSLSCGVAEARDLVEAANSAQTFLNRIGIAAISIGLTIGGILFAMGMAQVGRMVLFSGLVGAFAILGGPAVIGLISRIFGVG